MAIPDKPIESFDAAFFAWAAEQPASDEFDPSRPSVCALTQFVKSRGFEGHASGYGGRGYTVRYDYPAISYVAAIGANSNRYGHLFAGMDGDNFGDLKRRLEFLLSDQQASAFVYEQWPHVGISPL